MCNLYSMTKSVDAIRGLFGVDSSRDLTGNLPSLPGIYPDYPAPIVLNAVDGRELAMARWGIPSPSEVLKGKTDPGVTNIRDISSPYWRTWLGVDHRRLVPFTSFAEFDTIVGKKVQTWFCSRRDAAAALLCRPVDHLDQRAEGQGGTREGRAIRLPDVPAEQGSCQGPSKGDARYFHDSRGMQDLAAGAVERGEGAPAPAAGRLAACRTHRGEGGCLRMTGQAHTKFTADRRYADPQTAMARFLELANGLEADKGRISIGPINRTRFT